MSSKRAINIAIDGYSSTGKSTLARDLARSLQYRYIDTGAMYRAVTWYGLRQNYLRPGQINPGLTRDLDQLQVRLEPAGEDSRAVVYLNGEDVSTAIRSMEVAREVSRVAALTPVRQFLVAQQQEMARAKKVVMDGRDIGSVVLPEAELKIFVTAREEVRVMRRWRELQDQGQKVTREEVRENLRERDRIDTTREDSPLRQAADARLLDTSELNREQQLAIALGWAREMTRT